MAWTFKIFPSIGVARIGNNRSISPQDFYVGPEIPGTVIVPANGYKDSFGQVRRQAARFRIYGWENGVFMGEITSAVADITWTVELANTKAAFTTFHGIGHTNGPLRNASITDRSSLAITPGPRTIGLGGAASFDNGQFLGVTVPLGDIQTDANGRLLVLGGFGSSGSPTNAPLVTFANNNGWHDDVSDGPVNATVSLKGTKGPVQASGAWVICPPPRFAPPIFHIITLYDALAQTAVDRGLGFPVPATPSFTNDVFPILQRAIRYQWVTTKIGNKHSPLLAVIPPPATLDQRNAVFQALRDPATIPILDTPHLMPAVWTDFFEDLFLERGHGSPATGHWVNHPLTPTQYNVMKNWAAGNFINDWVGPPSPATNITPDGLTRAALENCSGGPFFPGIETSFFTRDLYPYIEPFRLDQSKQPDGTQLMAGDLSKQQAVPWQTDFFDCVFQSPLSWWPAAHPDDVFTAKSNNYVTWDRGLSNFSDMVNFWSGLGFLVQVGDSVIETERTL